MPELPDVVVYIRCFEERIVGQPLEMVHVTSPFLVRTYDPPIATAKGKGVVGISRLGKRIIWEFEDDLFMAIHLMIAGRPRCKKVGAKAGGRATLATFAFPNGTLVFTEAGSKKRASLHLVRGRDALSEFDRGGLEVFGATLDSFREALTRESHTLKRALTDPRLFSGIGNAYSDEILHRAHLSPLQRAGNLADDKVERLFVATEATLREWIKRLDQDVGAGFPDKVTAFREEMAVHGKHKEPCPECASPVQRIVYAQNECNYCATCQTGGKLLADRALSRLLKNDWPRSLVELEELRGNRPR